jgi:hypothetical protein
VLRRIQLQELEAQTQMIVQESDPEREIQVAHEVLEDLARQSIDALRRATL